MKEKIVVIGLFLLGICIFLFIRSHQQFKKEISGVEEIHEAVRLAQEKVVMEKIKKPIVPPNGGTVYEMIPEQVALEILFYDSGKLSFYFFNPETMERSPINLKQLLVFVNKMEDGSVQERVVLEPLVNESYNERIGFAASFEGIVPNAKDKKSIQGMVAMLRIQTQLFNDFEFFTLQNKKEPLPPKVVVESQFSVLTEYTLIKQGGNSTKGISYAGESETIKISSFTQPIVQRERSVL